MVRTAAEPAGLRPHAWQLMLRREMAALGRSADGRFADPSAARTGFVPVTRLLEPVHLADLIRRAGGLDTNATGAEISELDMTIAVSRFARQYCGSVSAVALVGLAHGIGIDMSPRHCRVMLTNADLPVIKRRFVTAVDLTAAEVVRCAQRPTFLPVSGPVLSTVDELREFVWSRLFGIHYDQLFRRVRELAPKVSLAVLWTSAAEYAGILSDAAEEHSRPDLAARYVADRQALFDCTTLPGMPGPNPLRGRLFWETVGEDPHLTVQTRRMCCLNYLLRERDGALCENCPYLAPEDRAALVRERRMLPPGAAGGRAARRAQEVGRGRPSYQLRQQRATAPGMKRGEKGTHGE